MTESQRLRCRKSRPPRPERAPSQKSYNVLFIGFLREVELGVSFAPFSAFREHFGFVPSLFRCQSLLPRLVEAETGLLASILFKDRSLSRQQKERVLLVLAV